ncbi:hypothetical protein [Deinococcus radiophilus]|uniref:hypothetical protein n=1 Tax=Deinococcus radiophilus TaxID=32062 RepID=UPI00361FA6F4
MLNALLLIPALFSAVTALIWLVQLPYPWPGELLSSARCLPGRGQRHSLPLLTVAWLGFLLLSGVMAGYAADELNRTGPGGEILSLGLGLGLLLALTLRSPATPHRA